LFAHSGILNCFCSTNAVDSGFDSLIALQFAGTVPRIPSLTAVSARILRFDLNPQFWSPLCWESIRESQRLKRMESSYPILLFVAVLIGFVITNLIIIHIVGPSKKTAVKQMPYESGMDPVGDARQPFDVKFYLVAILFLVFDVELLFLYPWAVSAYLDDPLRADQIGVPVELRGTVFAVMLVFMATLAIAYVYAWRKGVFRWR
jgi:NADH-quinone oxidoreductase subunit A